MMKKVIAGWNAAPGAPKGWDPARDGECGVLPIRVTVDQEQGGSMMCESAWEPTPRELQDLHAGGQLVLRIIGWQVPVALYVEPPPGDAAAPHGDAEIDNAAVDAFALAMKAKMALCREKGSWGWYNCTRDQLWAMLTEHVAKGDPIDIGNFAMMVWNIVQAEGPV